MTVSENLKQKIFLAMKETKLIHCEKIARIVGCTKRDVIAARENLTQSEINQIVIAVMTRNYYLSTKHVSRLLGVKVNDVKMLMDGLAHEAEEVVSRNRARMRMLMNSARRKKRDAKTRKKQSVGKKNDVLCIELIGDELEKYKKIKKTG